MLYTITSVPNEGLHFDFWSQTDYLSHANLSMNDLIFSEIMNLGLVVFYYLLWKLHFCSLKLNRIFVKINKNIGQIDHEI